MSGFDILLTSLKQQQRQALARLDGKDERLFAFSREMSAHVDAHRKIFRAMVGTRSGAAVKQQLHTLLVEFVREDVKAIGTGQKSNSPDALVQFLAGGFLSLLIWWLEGRSRMSVEETNNLFREFAIPAEGCAEVIRCG